MTLPSQTIKWLLIFAMQVINDKTTGIYAHDLFK